MRISRSVRRQGFTLLEVLLASALAVVLMAALYVALDVQLKLAADGRDAIDEATLTRAVVMRLENDLACSVGPVVPPIGNGGASSGSTGAAGATTPPATTPMGGGTTPTAPATADPAATGEAVMEMASVTATMPFQAGVIGEGDRLTIFMSKVAGLGKLADESPDGAGESDIRRVTYWMTATGLARQELPWVTSENAMASTDPIFDDGKEERDYVIAEEVTRVQFEYWDGSGWIETWDGRTLKDDGKTLKGPPAAIRVRFWLNVPGVERGTTVEKEFRHTISVRSAPGPAVPDNQAATEATTGTMP
jgi:prepilin-type N-terminal cleavage/methylation domain-containing protein